MIFDKSTDWVYNHPSVSFHVSLEIITTLFGRRPVGKNMYYFVMAVMVLSSVTGDWFLATYAKQRQDCRFVICCLMGCEIVVACVLGMIYPKAIYALAGFVFCTFAVACFLITLFYGTLFQASVNFDVITSAMVMAMSIFILKEKVGFSGIMWGVVALYCVFMMHRCIPD